MNIETFKKLPIMGILRDIPLSTQAQLIETVIDAGLKTIEITMNTQDACKLIKETFKISRGRLTIGAGTVLNIRELQQALDSGATFIVTPVLIKEVNKYCVKNKIPVFTGALTPTEIYEAWRAGSAMVKVFPASVFGPSYFKEIKGPFNEIELMAVGGANAETIPQYFSNGASAVAFGASVFRKDWINNKDFNSIEKSIKNLVAVTSQSVR